MARKAREKSSSGIYAVVLKCTEEIFRVKETKEILESDAQRYLKDGFLGLRFHNDRVDMLVKESEKGISIDMKPFITSFARTYNRNRKTDGKVFRDRFQSNPVETEELKAECLAYLDGGKMVSVYEKTRSYASGGKEIKKEENPKKNVEVKNRTEVKKKEKKITPVKTKEKKVETVKTEVKPVETQAVKPEEKPKKKKNNNLPSWLL